MLCVRRCYFEVLAVLRVEDRSEFVQDEGLLGSLVEQLLQKALEELVKPFRVVFLRLGLLRHVLLFSKRHLTSTVPLFSRALFRPVLVPLRQDFREWLDRIWRGSGELRLLQNDFELVFEEVEVGAAEQLERHDGLGL